MARGAILLCMKSVLVGEAFSLDDRGWKAAPTKIICNTDPLPLERVYNVRRYSHAAWTVTTVSCRAGLPPTLSIMLSSSMASETPLL